MFPASQSAALEKENSEFLLFSVPGLQFIPDLLESVIECVKDFRINIYFTSVA